MSVTPLVPVSAGSRLTRDLNSAEEAFARVRAAMPLAGDGAAATSASRVTVYPATPEAVDAIAALWHSTAAWNGDRTCYATRAGDAAGESEAVWVRPGADAAGGRAAA